MGVTKLTEIMQSNKKRINLKLESVLLFLFALDFFNNSGYIFIILLFYVLFKYLIYQKRLLLTNEFIIAILFAFSYFIMYSINFSLTFKSIVYYLIGPIGSYIIGRSLITNLDLDKSLYKTMMIIIVGLFIHGSLNMYIKISSGLLRYPSEYLIDFWRDEPISRTLQGLFLTPISGVLFASIFAKDRICSKYTRGLLIFCGLFSLWSTFMIANRTLIIISLILYIISIICFIYESKQKLTGSLLKVIFFCTALMLIFIFDAFSVRTFILNSPLLSRLNNLEMTMLETNRYERYIAFLRNFIYYPFGARKMPIYGGNSAYVHNVWFDIYVDVGIIPFLFFIIYTILMFKTFKNFFKISRSVFLKYFVFAIYGAFIMVFLAEPVIEANTYFIMMFFLINGSVSEYVFRKRNVVIKESCLEAQ